MMWHASHRASKQIFVFILKFICSFGRWSQETPQKSLENYGQNQSNKFEIVSNWHKKRVKVKKAHKKHTQSDRDTAA